MNLDNTGTNIVIDFEYPSILSPMFDQYRYKILYGGRGGAKSIFLANYCVEKAFSKGKNILCAREILKAIKYSVKSEVEDAIKRLKLSDYFSVFDQEIRCYNGAIFAFCGMRETKGNSSNVENLTSATKFDICWVEEASALTKTSLDLLTPTMRHSGSEILFSYNRKSNNEAVHKKFVDTKNPPPRTLVINITYEDNPWFPKELEEEKEYDKYNDTDDYNHKWLGLPKTFSSANIFKKWEVKQFEVPLGAKFYMGLDFGFSPDPCVILRSFPDWDTRTLYIDHCHYECNLDPTQIDHVLLDRVPNCKDNYIHADCARPEIISLLRKRGWKVKSVKKPPGSVEAGVDWLRAWNIIVHPRCMNPKDPNDEHTIGFELMSYKRKLDLHTGKVTSEIIKKHDHAIDALRYAYVDEIYKRNSLDYAKMIRRKIVYPKNEIEETSLILPPKSKNTNGGVVMLSAKDFPIKFPNT